MSTTTPVPASVLRQAEKLTIEAETLYNKGRIIAAIDAYTEAIVLNPDVAVSYIGRAECHRQKKWWDKVVYDCSKALLLDPNSFKGHYLLGLALLEKQENDKGIEKLERAIGIGQNRKLNDEIMDELWQKYCKVKFETWKKESSERLEDMRKLKDECETALKTCHNHNLDPFSSNGEPEEAERKLKGKLERLSQVFDKAAEEDREIEVPDYLCCKISLELFRDPVIAPSGITYERAKIIDHLNKVGQFDPVTRAPLKQNQLMPNLAIKDAMDAFLKRNVWAYQIHIDEPSGSDEE